MSYLKSITLAGAVAVGVAGTASAATYPTFVIDGAASSISLTQSSLGSATLSAEFSAGVDGYSWEAQGEYDHVVIDNFIDWDVSGNGLGSYDVEVTLAFSSPDAASGTISGGGGFGQISTFFGTITGGVLDWDNGGVTDVAFAQGSILTVAAEGGFAIGSGGVSSGVALLGNPIAPIPLPASGLLLLSALGGFGVVSRRRRKAAA